MISKNTSRMLQFKVLEQQRPQWFGPHCFTGVLLGITLLFATSSSFAANVESVARSKPSVRSIPDSPLSEEEADSEAEVEGDDDSNSRVAAERMRPGRTQPDDAIDWTDPNRLEGLKPVPFPDPSAASDFLPVPDRWRLAKDLSLVNESILDPYNRNILKADRPFAGDYFFNFSGIADTLYELRNIPTRVSQQVDGVGLDAGNGLDINGRGAQSLFNANLILSFDIYKGDTTFRPPDFEFRATPVINYNSTTTQELGVVNIDPRRGEIRNIGFVGMQELFVEKHLRNVSDRYDFDSMRVGIQAINADFRGFLFADNQLGARVFGNRDNNRLQYNVAWFRRLEKNINSGLNDIGQSPRNDDVYMVNVYRQDLPVTGFTSQATAVYNRNRESSDPLYYDQNGNPQRPELLGLERTRNYDVVYLGYNGDGHFGRLNMTHSYYYAVGNENTGTFQDAPTDISAWFAASEFSYDMDWNRVRLSALHGSGDSNPYDNQAGGFDAIFENPQFAGADTSFWIRQAVPLIGGGGVTINGRNGVLNSMRSSKELGQSNFSNPGISLFGIGSDHDIMPQVRISTNFNKLFFDNTAVLEAARNQGPIPLDIGWDLSTAVIYRPFFTQNIITRVSGAMLVPGDGSRALFGDRIMYSGLFDIVLAY